MADDLASAMRAGRGQGMDGALKAVEDMRLPGHFDFEQEFFETADAATNYAIEKVISIISTGR